MEGDNSKRRAEKAFYITSNIPIGDNSYARAKHFQLVEKDQESAILWFQKAINANDRVESALKDMAVVMKQQNRPNEAIESIKSFRHLCSQHSQESLDNLLIDLYKKTNRLDEQIHLLKQKLWAVYRGEAFSGRQTRTARSHGKKFQLSIKQETARLLGNLGWAYMHKGNYDAAEAVYRKAQRIEPDGNKACNLGTCLLRMGKLEEARRVIEDVVECRFGGSSESSVGRGRELMMEINEMEGRESGGEEIMGRLGVVMKDFWSSSLRYRRLPIFEEISPFRNQMAL